MRQPAPHRRGVLRWQRRARRGEHARRDARRAHPRPGRRGDVRLPRAERAEPALRPRQRRVDVPAAEDHRRDARVRAEPPARFCRLCQWQVRGGLGAVARPPRRRVRRRGRRPSSRRAVRGTSRRGGGGGRQRHRRQDGVDRRRRGRGARDACFRPEPHPGPRCRGLCGERGGICGELTAESFGKRGGVTVDLTAPRPVNFLSHM
mmetsp:Transcript_3999/g.12677  ORF Transcript_3999/g.12677 Transcript_3999/m.12677 type:complete len:205 (-) Transcript_3999:50-664(-)